MKIEQVITYRTRSKGHDYGIVNEWEDVFAESLMVPLWYDDWKKRIHWILYKFPWIAEWFMQTWKNSFVFTMLPLGNPSGNNKRNIVPCLIDFFLRDQKSLNIFYKRFRKNPLVMISSKEAYEYLKAQGCPLNIRHLALSISDKYRVSPETSFSKEYDVVMLGRQNQVLLDYLERYKNTHPKVTYVYGKKTEDVFMYYDSDGRAIGALETREEYMAMMRKSRIGLYATPGMDGGREHTNGFNQVTPRFLEYLVSGCHVIARFPKNADTDFYELEKMTTNAHSYELFEQAMDLARSTAVDMRNYATYLEKHYTSERVKTLLEYLKEI